MSDESTKGLTFKQKIIYAVVLAIIGLIVFFVEEKIRSRNQTPSSTNNTVVSDSATQNNFNNQRDAFQNSGSGQQNNNTDSGTQIVKNVK